MYKYQSIIDAEYVSGMWKRRFHVSIARIMHRDVVRISNYYYYSHPKNGTRRYNIDRRVIPAVKRSLSAAHRVARVSSDFIAAYELRCVNIFLSSLATRWLRKLRVRYRITTECITNVIARFVVQNGRDLVRR